MAFSYGFFNAIYDEGVPDRTYTADNFAEFFDSIIGDGVSGSIQDCFKVSPNSGMSVQVNQGFAWMNGYYAKNTTPYAVTIPTAPPNDSRIDAVVLRWSRINRNITIAVISGTASGNPLIPELTRDTSVYELMLGYVTITAGDTEITDSMITDTRSDTTVCGIIDTFSSRLIPDNSIPWKKMSDEGELPDSIRVSLQALERAVDQNTQFSKWLTFTATGTQTISDPRFTADHILDDYQFFSGTTATSDVLADITVETGTGVATITITTVYSNGTVRLDFAYSEESGTQL